MTREDKLKSLFESDFQSDAAAFKAAVKSILSPQPHPRQRVGHQKRESRTPDVIALMWAKVEFMIWRDRKTIIDACDALQKFTDETKEVIEQYDTTDYRWRRGEEVKPSSFSYQPKWNKTTHNDYSGLEHGSRMIGELYLEQMQAAHNGEPSILSAEFMEKSFPPKKEK